MVPQVVVVGPLEVAQQTKVGGNEVVSQELVRTAALGLL
jgi:hypothetical protein